MIHSFLIKWNMQTKLLIRRNYESLETFYTKRTRNDKTLFRHWQKPKRNSNNVKNKQIIYIERIVLTENIFLLTLNQVICKEDFDANLREN